MSVYTNCTKCKSHKIMPDPDPYDWFCDDDVKVMCLETKKYITESCRPQFRC